jgi:hypothetical protein
MILNGKRPVAISGLRTSKATTSKMRVLILAPTDDRRRRMNRVGFLTYMRPRAMVLPDPPRQPLVTRSGLPSLPVRQRRFDDTRARRDRGYHAAQRLSASPVRETGLPVPDQLAPGQLAQADIEHRRQEQAEGLPMRRNGMSSLRRRTRSIGCTARERPCRSLMRKAVALARKRGGKDLSPSPCSGRAHQRKG